MAAPNIPNTSPARLAKKRNATKRAKEDGTLAQLQSRVWSAINRLDSIVNDSAADPALVLRASHALFQGASAYTKVLEAGESEARLAALEAHSSSCPPTF